MRLPIGKGRGKPCPYIICAINNDIIYKSWIKLNKMKVCVFYEKIL